MKKNKKILLILLFLIFTTGCQVTTNITINKDLTVLEELKLTGTAEFFNNRYKTMPINVLKNVLKSEDRESILKENGYFYEVIKPKGYPYTYVSKKYSSLNEFASNTIFKNQYFEDLNVEYNNNLITLKSKNFIPYEDGDLERYDIKSFTLNIKLPYVVKEHNADSYNKKTNTYSWNIKSETSDKDINITFDKNQKYVYNIAMYISIIILCLIGIIIFFIIRKTILKHKINNKISE